MCVKGGGGDARTDLTNRFAVFNAKLVLCFWILDFVFGIAFAIYPTPKGGHFVTNLKTLSFINKHLTLINF